MEKRFNETAYADMEAVGGKAWCEENIEYFVGYLTSELAPEEMTQGNIRKAAEAYIQDFHDDEEFAEVRAKIEAENPMMLGIYTAVMAEYMLELVINRG